MRRVTLTIEVEEGGSGDFITGRPRVVDARPEPLLFRLWRRFSATKALGEARDTLGTSLGVLAGPETFVLLTGADTRATTLDLIPMAGPEPALEDVNV